MNLNSLSGTRYTPPAEEEQPSVSGDQSSATRQKEDDQSDIWGDPKDPRNRVFTSDEQYREYASTVEVSGEKFTLLDPTATIEDSSPDIQQSRGPDREQRTQFAGELGPGKIPLPKGQRPDDDQRARFAEAKRAASSSSRPETTQRLPPQYDPGALVPQYSETAGPNEHSEIPPPATYQPPPARSVLARIVGKKSGPPQLTPNNQALHTAARNGDIETVIKSIDNGASVTAVAPGTKQNSLHQAAMSAKLTSDITFVLSDKVPASSLGSAAAAQDVNGNTPIHLGMRSMGRAEARNIGNQEAYKEFSQKLLDTAYQNGHTGIESLKNKDGKTFNEMYPEGFRQEQQAIFREAQERQRRAT